LTVSPVNTSDDIDRFLRITYALLMFRQGGIVFHSAAMVRDGQAYLFYGPSGTGKTTASRCSRETPGVQVLNDDLVVLLHEQSRWMVYATPFSNPSQVPPSGPCAAPLAAAFRLVQAPRVWLDTQPGRAQTLAEVLAGTLIVPGFVDTLPRLVAWWLRVLEAIPFYRLHFLPDASFWSVVSATKKEPQVSCKH
jgi:hypothetical protein